MSKVKATVACPSRRETIAGLTPLARGDAGIGVTQPVQGDRRQRRGGNEAHKQRADALRVQLLTVGLR
jgi:hypothetical protein